MASYKYWVTITDGKPDGVFREAFYENAYLIEILARKGWRDATAQYADYVFKGERGALRTDPETAAEVLMELYGYELSEKDNLDQPPPSLVPVRKRRRKRGQSRRPPRVKRSPRKPTTDVTSTPDPAN